MPDFSAYSQLVTGQLVAVGLIIVVLLLLSAAVLFRKLRPWQSYLRAKPILTPNEREFFHRLTRALSTYPIFPQVAFSALIAVDSRLSERQQFTIRRFEWKYATL